MTATMTSEQYRQMVATEGKPRKYRNKPVTVDGERYDSAAEQRRHGELKQLAMANQIRDIRRQVPFDLHTWAEGQKVKLTVYVADFTYRDTRSGRQIVEDVKGPERNDTPLFKLKAKWMRVEHGIEIKIVRK